MQIRWRAAFGTHTGPRIASVSYVTAVLALPVWAKVTKPAPSVGRNEGRHRYADGQRYHGGYWAEAARADDLEWEQGRNPCLLVRSRHLEPTQDAIRGSHVQTAVNGSRVREAQYDPHDYGPHEHEARDDSDPTPPTPLVTHLHAPQPPSSVRKSLMPTVTGILPSLRAVEGSQRCRRSHRRRSRRGVRGSVPMPPAGRGSH